MSVAKPTLREDLARLEKSAWSDTARLLASGRHTEAAANHKFADKIKELLRKHANGSRKRVTK